MFSAAIQCRRRSPWRSRGLTSISRKLAMTQVRINVTSPNMTARLAGVSQMRNSMVPKSGRGRMSQ